MTRDHATILFAFAIYITIITGMVTGLLSSWYGFYTLFGVFALLLIQLARRGNKAEYRRKAGLCLICGYDLRASEGACPECGFGPAEVD